MIKTRLKRNALFGFTLLELMAVVTIIGILAAVAVPSLLKYLKKSKSVEATSNLRKIYDGEISYYQSEYTLSSGVLASKQFVGYSPLPVSVGINKQSADFTGNGWDAIKFIPDGPVLYSYSVDESGVNESAMFTARAEGDVDGDGTRSSFERVCKITSSGDIEGGGGVYMIDPTE